MTLTLIKKYNKKYKKTYIFLIIVAIIIIIIIVYLFSKKNENFGVDMFSYDATKWIQLPSTYTKTVSGKIFSLISFISVPENFSITTPNFVSTSSQNRSVAGKDDSSINICEPG